MKLFKERRCWKIMKEGWRHMKDRIKRPNIHLIRDPDEEDRIKLSKYMSNSDWHFSISDKRNTSKYTESTKNIMQGFLFTLTYLYTAVKLQGTKAKETLKELQRKDRSYTREPELDWQ